MKVGGEQEEEKSWRIVQVVHVEVATNARKLVLKAGINEAFFRPPVVLEHEGDPSACTACMHVRIVRVGVGVGTFFGKRRERKKGNKGKIPKHHSYTECRMYAHFSLASQTWLPDQGVCNAQGKAQHCRSFGEMR